MASKNLIPSVHWGRQGSSMQSQMSKVELWKSQWPACWCPGLYVHVKYVHTRNTHTIYMHVTCVLCSVCYMYMLCVCDECLLTLTQFEPFVWVNWGTGSTLCWWWKLEAVASGDSLLLTATHTTTLWWLGELLSNGLSTTTSKAGNKHGGGGANH